VLVMFYSRRDEAARLRDGRNRNRQAFPVAIVRLGATGFFLNEFDALGTPVPGLAFICECAC
jgi:hypothetical protein